MQREIKFRAWDRKRSEWLDPSYFYLYLDGLTIKHVKGGAKTDVELSQYTGLNDKNGAQIYEGDIIETEYIGNKAIQYIDNGFWCITDEGNKEIPYAENRKIIGNIYENPELISAPAER